MPKVSAASTTQKRALTGLLVGFISGFFIGAAFHRGLRSDARQSAPFSGTRATIAPRSSGPCSFNVIAVFASRWMER
jgi:hypothetical protein